ncbi:FAD:protein FMN transferase [Botrimarina hoheduenensis]|nr:FAD:protein FMN transferase [Botrimarina hoheduenensis]
MDHRRQSRRDFLRGRSALGAAADLIGSAIDTAADAIGNVFPESPPPAALPRHTEQRIVTLARRAMACEWELRLVVSREQNETTAGMAALDLVERLEDQLTVYRDDSELIDINRNAAATPWPVEARLFELLQLAGELYDETGGAFDLTSGPLSQVWGFAQRAGVLPQEDARLAALQQVGWSDVMLDPAERTLQYLREGIEINVNSIGKGYALDRAGELLSERGVEASLMHGGTSTLLARGVNPLAEGAGWEVGLGDPTQPDQRLAKFVLRDEAFSTSGSGTQFFEYEGRRYGHLIDPRTGWPAEGLHSASVIAPTAAQADALSTACYILGVEGTAELCERRPDLCAVLLAPATDADGAPSVRIHAFNFQRARPNEPHPFREGVEVLSGGCR